MKIEKIILLLIVLLAFSLRIYKVDSVPPSPYWEEAALGYDAFSILKTGHDHHGNLLPLIAFESFGDWKPSLYFYALIPGIAIWGLNTFAVRLPSILSGVFAVWAIYFLIINLANSESKKIKYVGLFSSLFLAISPWSLQLSRVGFEANLALNLALLGAVFLLKFKNNQKKSINIILSSIFFGLSLYTYHGERVFVPLLILFWGLGVAYQKLHINFSFNKLFIFLRKYLLGILLLLTFVLPIGLQMKSPEVMHRFSETSAFTSLEPIIASNKAIKDAGGGILAKLIHHRFWYYGKIFAQNYLSHFSYKFLFRTGDINVRHSSQFVGELYSLYLPFLILGIYYLFFNKFLRNKISYYLFSWLLLAPVAASLTTGAPHSLRSYPLIISLIILVAIGLVFFIENILDLFKDKSKSKIFYIGAYSLFGLALFISFIRFYTNYLTIYPQKYSQAWQYGYRDVVQYIEQHKLEYDQIFLSRSQGRPSMYYWFYTKQDPRKVQLAENKSQHDQGEFLEYENIYFERKLLKKGKTLMVDSQIAKGVQPLKTIYFLDGKPAFYIWQENL